MWGEEKHQHHLQEVLNARQLGKVGIRKEGRLRLGLEQRPLGASWNGAKAMTFLHSGPARHPHPQEYLWPPPFRAESQVDGLTALDILSLHFPYLSAHSALSGVGSLGIECEGWEITCGDTSLAIHRFFV